MNNKKALITGITGQDGAYLAEFLLKKGYEVHGIKRRSSLFNTDRIDHLYEDPHVDNRKFILHYGDLTDSTSLVRIIQQVQPDEIYNLAAQSHVAVSFEEPEYTANSDALGSLRILEAIRAKLEQSGIHATVAGVLLAFTLGGGLAALHSFWAPRLDGMAYGLAMIFSVMGISGLIDLPLSLYRQFVIEARHGFNRMTLGLFFSDLVKQTLLGVAIVVVTHELGSIEVIADQVVMLDSGKILAKGALKDVRALPHPKIRAFFDRTPRETTGESSLLDAILVKGEPR